MAKRSERMTLLVMLAKREEDKLAADFQQYSIALREQEARLAELIEYYESYQQQFALKTQNLRSQDILNARGLLQRLADAQHFQKQQIRIAKDTQLKAQNAWQKAYLKRQSLEDLKTRSAIDEASVEAKEEQKMADEWASSAFNHRNR